MTSELDKWSAVHADSVILEEFLEFLSGKGISLCEVYPPHDQFYPVKQSLQDLIYEHFGIDPQKLEKERRELLEVTREKNKGMPAT